MRKYLLFIFAAILFVGFSFPATSNAAIADGTYSIQYQVNKPGSNSASMANDYFLKPAKLIVNNGKMTMQMTIKKSAWVTEFNPPGGAKVISANDAADQRVVQFSVSNANLTTIGMKIDIDEIDYHHAYSVDFVFNSSGLPEAKAEEPKQQATPAPAPKAEEPAKTEKPATTTPQSSGSNTSSNKPATSTEKVTNESSNAQAQPAASNDESKQSDEQEQSSTAETEQAEESEAVENPETSDELPMIALLLLIAAIIVFIRTKQTKTTE